MLALPASAARANFTVYPSLVDLHAHAGGVASGTIEVKLAGERGRGFRIGVQNVLQNADGSYRYAPPSNSAYSASTWVSVRPGRFSGTPDRVQPIEYVVRVPKGAEPGDHVASLTVERLPTPGQVTVAEAVSVRLTIRLPGAIRRSARLEALSAPTLTGGGSVTSDVEVLNTGNVRLDFGNGDNGGVAIVGGDHTKAETSFDGPVFPGQRRRFTVVWNDTPFFGHFKAAARLALRGQRPLTAAHGFWILPWRQLGALLLLVAAVAVARGRPARRRVEA